MSKIFTDKEIEKYLEDIKIEQTFDRHNHKLTWHEGFKEGIEFSENKTMHLLSEFAKYIEECVGDFTFVDLRNNPPTDMSNEDLIKMFLEERENKNDR